MLQSVSILTLISVILLVSNMFTHNSGSFDFLSFIITAIIGLIGLYGIGIILAGISLISKEINLVSALVKIGVIYAIIKIDENVKLPFSYAKNILTEIILNNNTLFSFPIEQLGLLVLNSCLWFVLGLVCFYYIERIALKQGKLIGY